MSRPSYDDMVTDNSKRGKKATRATVLGVMLVLLVVLIILVVYLIANPGKPLDITEPAVAVDNSGTTALTVENTAVKEEKKTLFNFSSYVEETTPDDNTPLVETSSPVTEITTVEKTEDTADEPVYDFEVDYVPETMKETIPEEDSHPIVVEETPITVAEETTDGTLSEDIPPVEETAPEESEAAPEEIIHPEEEITSPGTVETEEENVTPAEEEDFLLSVDSSLVVSGGTGVIENGKLVITGESGSAVRALLDGTVTAAGKENGLKYIMIECADGSIIKYSGFERVVVTASSRIRSGAVLGSIGLSSSSKITLSYIPAGN